MQSKNDAYFGPDNYARLRLQKLYLRFKINKSTTMKFSAGISIASSSSGEIVVADANQHLIFVFWPNADFKFMFGGPGENTGQLLYPACVSVCGRTDRILVAERSPRHQVQVFSTDGEFLLRFGQEYLKSPRALAVDQFGNVIVVESRVMEVTIFSDVGELLRKVKCGILKFPNGLAVDKSNRILISDNLAHCVHAFNYYGEHLMTVGGESLTKYPIGVGCSTDGDILIADNHGSFKISLFEQGGSFKGTYSTAVKHQDCTSFAVGAGGVLAFASRDSYVHGYVYEK